MLFERRSKLVALLRSNPECGDCATAFDGNEFSESAVGNGHALRNIYAVRFQP